jgi:toxin ParE1/3/4
MRLNAKRAADRLLDTIDDACGRLAKYPQSGPARTDLAPELRSSAIGSYLILYREAADGIEIVRVVHGARRLADLL